MHIEIQKLINYKPDDFGSNPSFVNSESEIDPKIISIIRERLAKSKIYDRLSGSQKAEFERTVYQLTEMVFSGSNRRTIKDAWQLAFDESGVNDYLQEHSSELSTSFGVKPPNIQKALRNATKDVAHVLSDPKLFNSFRDLEQLRFRSAQFRGQIVGGGELHSKPSGPPNLQRTTLRRK